MCTNKTQAPDTSAQEAEAARQRDAENAYYQQQLTQQKQIADQQRADDERRYQEQQAAQQAEVERQRQVSAAEAARQQAASQQAEAQRQQEAAATKAAADQKAAQAREFATQRQAKMDEASKAVNSAYAGFDDKAFSDFAQQFVDAYHPALQREYKAQNDATTNGFADAGTLRSSIAAKSFGDLTRGLNEKEGQLTSAAADASNTYRNDVIGQKSDALASINAAGSAATPVLADGSLDVASGLTSLQGQLGQLTQTAQNKAQAVKAPSFTNAFNASLAGYARRPGVAA